MFIILKNDHLLNKKQVVTILYDSQCDKWVKTYLNNEKNSLESTDQINYMIEDNCLIKNETIINKGYLYNNKTTKQTKLFSLETYFYDAKEVELSNTTENIGLWEDISSEINRRTLKNMDKDSLYQVFVKLNENLKVKQNWTHYEFTSLLNEILKNFKKELYSSVAKKLKRFRKSD